MTDRTVPAGDRPVRHLVAAGIIRRTAAGRTLRITATPAGITGSIRPAGAR
jgi:hypothetical protein